PAFTEILEDAATRIRRLMNIPSDYEVLFLQGGGRLQNAMIPMNLMDNQNQVADYLVTGSWGKKSSEEVHHYGKLNVAWDGANQSYSTVPTADDLKLTDDAAYVHFTSNETIQGVQFPITPEISNAPLVCDQSSDILCRPRDVSKYGLIYACAQKNIGVAGLTLVVIRKDLMERAGNRLAGYLTYNQHAKAGSRFNTPPTFSIYVFGLVCKWIEETMGGVEKVHDLNLQKSQLLYDVVDQSGGFYTGHAKPDCRSIMNVVFKLANEELDSRFLEQAAQNGMTTLKGHRSLGGIRASVYNAMPLEGAQTLSDFMKDFAKNNG
ncbi:3-phosphoserine/phosphohydroxythreonine transaminase, partial [bacterium]|nr:3-phosphoserine/phosphohydroxythreonine transaminase [bacterium]